MPDFASPGWLWLLLALPLVALARARGGVPETGIKRTAGIVLRSIALASLIVALAGPLRGGVSQQTDVVFALDVSSSVGERTIDRAVSFINRAFAAKGPRS